MSMVNNPFIKTFGNLTKEGKHISKEEFMDQFSELVKILQGFGVEIFDEAHDEITKLPNYDALVKEVQLVYGRLREKPKVLDVAEHDAYHLLLVKKLRNPEEASLLGPDYWFLSCDLTLPCTDKFIQDKFGFAEKTSSVMIPSLWNEIISPFLIGLVTQKDLVEVFRSFLSSEFTPISEGVNAGVMAKLEIDWNEYDWLEYEEIQKITNMKFVLQYLSQVEELTKAGNTKALEELRTQFNISFSSLIGEISSRKIAAVQKQLVKKTEETETLKSTVSDLETVKHDLQSTVNSDQSTIKRVTTLSLRMRYIAGFSGVCLLIIGAILIIQMSATASIQIVGAYGLFLLIGAVLLLMAIAPERVSGTVGTKI
jgi:hypothetical protein